MHHTHIFKVTAQNRGDACSQVEDYLEGYYEEDPDYPDGEPIAPFDYFTLCGVYHIHARTAELLDTTGWGLTRARGIMCECTPDTLCKDFGITETELFDPITNVQWDLENDCRCDQPDICEYGITSITNQNPTHLVMVDFHT